MDDRGYFARTYDAAVLPAIAQMSISYSASAGTLRGLHYQADPHAEAKLVRCTRGAIFDVAIDVRSESPTRYRWLGVELNAWDGIALLVPKGFAHGFQTLTDDTEVLYAMDAPHVPEAARGVRWNDPAFGIRWPEPPAGGRTMSSRDAAYAFVDGS